MSGNKLDGDDSPPYAAATQTYATAASPTYKAATPPYAAATQPYAAATQTYATAASPSYAAEASHPYTSAAHPYATADAPQSRIATQTKEPPPTVVRASVKRPAQSCRPMTGGSGHLTASWGHHGKDSCSSPPTKQR